MIRQKFAEPKNKARKEAELRFILVDEPTMKISQSTIALQSQHASAQFRSTQSTLRTWVGAQRPDFEGREATRSLSSGVSLSLSGSARAHLAQRSAALAKAPAPAAKTEAAAQGEKASSIDPRLRMLMEMFEALTGKRMKVFDARELQGAPAADVAAVPTPSGSPQAAPAPTPAGWGLEFDSHEVRAELESTSVSAQGVVQTADGQTIAFSLNLQMSRAYVEERSVSVREGDAVRKDPLVINFDGAGAQLTDMQFAFDLDADGTQENMAFVSAGSGFLALDKNADGKINDGGELFGTRSGNGFADLAQYDQDGNHWIDENDAIYSQLRIWQKDANGQDRLRSLAQAQVGALHLGQVASPFAINNASNQNLGQVRSSGVYLYESGQAGALQQVDLSVRPLQA